MSQTVAPTGPADLRDQAWLDEQVATLGDGIEAARNIWTNWFDGRNVGRLHPGMGPGEYIANLGLRLTLAEAMAALPDGSNRQVATAAGVSEGTVRNHRSGAQVYAPDEPPARVIGADGKSYPGRVVRVVEAAVIQPEEEEATIDEPVTNHWLALVTLMKHIESMAAIDVAEVAASVPERRRVATARRLRRLGTHLGRIAWTLEGTGAVSNDDANHRRPDSAAEVPSED